MDGAAARWHDHAPAEWAALLAGDPSASPSHRPEVGLAFAAAMPGYAWRLVTFEERGELVGGAPVVIAHRAAHAWVHALPMMLPAPPLARPGRHAEVDVAIAHAVDAFCRERRAVGGQWSWYRPAGPEPAPGALESLPGTTRAVDAGIVELAGGVEGALSRIGRKERAALRRPRGAALAFSDDAARLEAAYALHVAQSRRWGGHRPLPLELSRRLLASGDVARVFSLSDSRGVVSGALALDGPHETFVWWSGTHPDGRSLGAFGLLLWRIVEWAAARGRARVNLGASVGLPGVAAFKRSLGVRDVRYPVREFDARHAGVTGRLLAALQARRRARVAGEDA